MCLEQAWDSGQEQGQLRLPCPVPCSEALGGISTARFLFNHHHLPPSPSQPWAEVPEETVTGICQGQGQGAQRGFTSTPPKKITLLAFITIHCVSVKQHPRVLPRGRSESRAPCGSRAAPHTFRSGRERPAPGPRCEEPELEHRLSAGELGNSCWGWTEPWGRKY